MGSYVENLFSLEGRVALCTGASSGIGRELARQLVEQGGRVVATARREERLQSLATELSSGPGEFHSIAGDVTLPEDRRQLLAECVARFGGLDVLINNAGRGAIGQFADTTDDRCSCSVLAADNYALDGR